MAGIDLNRTTTGAPALLPRDVSQEIWAATVNDSAIMQASRQIALPGGGITIPMITGDATAGWVNETDEKPVSNAKISSKNMTGYTLAVIETFSNQFRRDLPGLYAELARRLPYALGSKFDSTVLYGTAPGSDFDVLADAQATPVKAASVLDDLSGALTKIAATGADLSHWLISPQAEGLVRTAKDGQGNYAFLADARTDNGTIGSVYGRPVQKSKALYQKGEVSAADVLGIAGDFAGSAIVGIVEGIKVDISDQATVTKDGVAVNLWQRNMFAVRAEVELGFIVRDKAHFTRLTSK